jgi:hypothetical protein
MHWYQAEFRAEDRHSRLLDELDDLRLSTAARSSCTCRLGRTYPSATHLRVWLCFDPAVPVNFEGWVGDSGLVIACAPDLADASISWGEPFAIPENHPRDRSMHAASTLTALEVERLASAPRGQAEVANAQETLGQP